MVKWESLFDDSSNQKTFELPGARPHYNPDRPGQVEHIFLDLALDISNHSFTGVCNINLNPVVDRIKNLQLDAVNLHIQSVEVDGEHQDFDYDGEKLNIHLSNPTLAGEKIGIAINYSVEKPQRGLYFISPTPEYPDKPTQVWTQGEDEDSRFWFPCFDYPGQLATSEIRVRVPKQYTAISNGELIATTEEGEEKVYHWLQREIHPSYLMTLAVGDFAEFKDEWQGKPITYFVEKSKQDQALLSMGKTPKMVEFFSNKFGYPYPYPKYAQVCVDDFIFGGMENTSTTLLTDRCLLDEKAAVDNRNTESLVAHELAHQWFGDLVVIKHWSHAWIKEGMASYCEVLWTEHEYTKDEAAYYLLNEARSYLSEDSSRYRRPIVTNVYREAIELYDRHLYEKGACVYHMIRAELGDELFDKAIQTFVKDNAHKTVETVDLLRAIEKATGRNLLFLFDQYVYRGGHPDFKVGYSWDGDSNLAKVTVNQTQVKGDNGKTNDLFDLKIPINFGFSNGDLPIVKTFTVRINQKEQSFYFPLESKPVFVSFDAGNNYLKTVELEYPLPELKAQLELDPDPIARIYAAAALAKKGSLEAVKALSKSLQTEPLWCVRMEVAKNLGEIKLDTVFDELVVGLQDENPYVRRAVVEALGDIKTDESYAAIKEVVAKGDASYYVEASAIRALGGMVATSLKEKEAEAIALYAQILKEKSGWNELIRSAAIGGLSQIKSSAAALDLIIEYTRTGVPQPLRLAAIRALGAISTGQSSENVARILDLLAEISRDTFFLTQVSMVSALGQMETTKAIALLSPLANASADGRVRRIAEEAIAKVQKKSGSDSAIKQLREELDGLKKENQELKTRLENLEAKSS